MGHGLSVRAGVGTTLGGNVSPVGMVPAPVGRCVPGTSAVLCPSEVCRIAMSKGARSVFEEGEGEMPLCQ